MPCLLRTQCKLISIFFRAVSSQRKACMRAEKGPRLQSAMTSGGHFSLLLSVKHLVNIFINSHLLLIYTCSRPCFLSCFILTYFFVCTGTLRPHSHYIGIILYHILDPIRYQNFTLFTLVRSASFTSFCVGELSWQLSLLEN